MKCVICDICKEMISDENSCYRDSYIIKKKWFTKIRNDTWNYTNKIVVCSNCINDFENYLIEHKGNKLHES